MNFFDDINYLEPKCPHCLVRLDYGVNTKFDNTKKCEICLNCGKEI